jgi:sugar phosphate isomerase/epimerase
MREVARAAAECNTWVAIEPMHRSIHDSFSFVNTIPDAVSFISDIGESNVGLLFDAWHLSDTPNVQEHIRESPVPFIGVHIDDRPHHARSWCDRLLPGDGVADLVGIISALRDRGFDGWYELEIFSDDGTYGNDFSDSLWKLTPQALIRKGHQRLLEIWTQVEPGFTTQASSSGSQPPTVPE